MAMRFGMGFMSCVRLNGDPFLDAFNIETHLEGAKRHQGSSHSAASKGNLEINIV